MAFFLSHRNAIVIMRNFQNQIPNIGFNFSIHLFPLAQLFPSTPPISFSQKSQIISRCWFTAFENRLLCNQRVSDSNERNDEKAFDEDFDAGAPKLYGNNIHFLTIRIVLPSFGIYSPGSNQISCKHKHIYNSESTQQQLYAILHLTGY